jgi:hypothetical protein
MSRKPPEIAPRQAIAFSRKGYVSARAVGSFLPALTTKAFQKYGFSTVSLITDWPGIVGNELAKCTSPERLKWRRREGGAEGDDPEPAGRSGATLVLRVDSAKALDVQYQARQIIERINTHFGYAAVTDLRLVQAPVPLHQPGRTAKPRAQPAALAVEGIADTGLRDALARLGCGIRGGL